MQPEQLQYTFGIRHHFFMLGGTFFRLDDLYQLDLVELVDANHSSSAHARCSGFASKTRSVSAVINWKLAFLKDFLAMNVCHRRFGGWDEVQLAQRGSIQAFLNGVILIGKLRELAHSFQALRTDHQRWGHLCVTVLGGMQLEHELNQGPLKFRAAVGI